MTGYAMCHSYCYGCGKLFAFNPMRVPSVRVRGVREPICRDCVERVNPERVKNKLAPIVPHPDAYEPCEEGELHD